MDDNAPLSVHVPTAIDEIHSTQWQAPMAHASLKNVTMTSQVRHSANFIPDLLQHLGSA